MNVMQKWIEAGKILAVNPVILVSCPECGKGNLSIHDCRSKGDPSVVERTMTCQICGASNAMRLVRPVDETSS
jgi:hypothetical protein